jgi:type II secretory pathway component HofQ
MKISPEIRRVGLKAPFIPAIPVRCLMGLFLFITILYAPPLQAAAVVVKQGLHAGANGLSANLTRVPVKKVMKMLAATSRVDVYLDKGLDGRISTKFSGMPLKVALRRLLRGYNYALIFDNNGKLVSVRLLRSGENVPHQFELIKGRSDGVTSFAATAASGTGDAGSASSSPVSKSGHISASDRLRAVAGKSKGRVRQEAIAAQARVYAQRRKAEMENHVYARRAAALRNEILKAPPEQKSKLISELSGLEKKAAHDRQLSQKQVVDAQRQALDSTRQQNAMLTPDKQQQLASAVTSKQVGSSRSRWSSWRARRGRHSFSLFGSGTR